MFCSYIDNYQPKWNKVKPNIKCKNNGFQKRHYQEQEKLEAILQTRDNRSRCVTTKRLREVVGFSKFSHNRCKYVWADGQHATLKQIPYHHRLSSGGLASLVADLPKSSRK